MGRSDGFNTVSYNEKMFMILTLHRIIYGNIIKEYNCGANVIGI